MKKRFGIVIGGGDSSGSAVAGAGLPPTAPLSTQHQQQGLDTSISGFCSVDEGVDLLATRMGRLDHRIAHIEQQDLAARTSSSSRPRHSAKSNTNMNTNISRNSRSSKQQQRVGLSVSSGQEEDNSDSVDSLEATWTFAQLADRVTRTEAAVAKMAKRDRDREKEGTRMTHSSSSGGGGGSRHRRRAGTDEEQYQPHPHQQQQGEGEGEEGEAERVQGQIRSLQRKLKTLGDSTSRACRSLSVGVTDAQNASLQLFSWADKVHMAFDHVSKDCLKLSKNILPRAKLLELSSTSTSTGAGAIADRGRSSSRGGGGGGGQARRSVSAGEGGGVGGDRDRGGRRRRKKRSQSQEHSSGGVDSDYEISF